MSNLKESNICNYKYRYILLIIDYTLYILLIIDYT